MKQGFEQNHPAFSRPSIDAQNQLLLTPQVADP